MVFFSVMIMGFPVGVTVFSGRCHRFSRMIMYSKKHKMLQITIIVILYIH